MGISSVYCSSSVNRGSIEKRLAASLGKTATVWADPFVIFSVGAASGADLSASVAAPGNAAARCAALDTVDLCVGKTLKTHLTTAGSKVSEFRTSDWDRDVATNQTTQGALWSDNPPTDSSAFRQRGGKLIIRFCMNDTGTFCNVAEYGESVQAEIRKSEGLSDETAGVKTRESIRLLTLPGVSHLCGGKGPNTKELLPPLIERVEKAVSPVRIDATCAATPKCFDASLGRPMSRPVCAYPRVGRYIGHGDNTKARSFTSSKPDVPDAVATKSPARDTPT